MNKQQPSQALVICNIGF